MEEIKIRELPENSSVEATDYIPIENIDGTKKVLVKHFRSLVLTSLYFNNIDELKNSPSVGLKEGDVCETLGYNSPGDGGGAKYRITYNPAAVEDGKLVHYLSYSDTLRAELIESDTINVHQFGAVGDGKTDDTDAIQAALDYADSKVVEFTNNKIYVTRNSLNICKSNMVINGNGAIIYPHYVDGIYIYPKEETDEPISDIIINNLNFDCSRAISAISVNRVSKLDINESNVDKITTKGIDLKNSIFVNIEKCKFTSNNTGSSILLEGSDDATTPANSCRFININNSKFKGFSKAVHVLSTGNIGDGINTLINLTNCHYGSEVIGSTCIYIASPIEAINIKSNTTDDADTFLYFGGASKGNVSCRDISCLGTNKIFNVGASQGVLTLEGTINVDSTAVMFENMIGKLHSNIIWDLLPIGASFTNPPIGELFDTIHPTQYSDKNGYSLVDSKLTLRQVRNMYIDWDSSTNNLDEIINGVNGQLLYIKSSTNKSIIAVTNKIVLSANSISLGPYSGILLKYDGIKWVQVEDVPYTFNSQDQDIENAISTYDVWKSLGNEGGPQDFIDSLKGTDGQSGVGIANISATAIGGVITFNFLLDNGETKTTSVVLS